MFQMLVLPRRAEPVMVTRLIERTVEQSGPAGSPEAPRP